MNFEKLSKTSYKLSEIVMGEGVVVFPGCVVGRPPMAPKGVTEIDYNSLESKPVYIGDNTILGCNAIIYNDVKIGKNCIIGDGVVIRENVEIGDNCIIGINTKVGARTKIGNYSRIMDLTNLSSDGVVGEHVFIGPSCSSGNDNAMGRNSAGNGLSYTGLVVEDYVTIGMNTSILPNTRIGKDSIIAAHSIVSRDIAPGILAMGQPAKKVRDLIHSEVRIR